MKLFIEFYTPGYGSKVKKSTLSILTMFPFSSIQLLETSGFYNCIVPVFVKEPA